MVDREYRADSRSRDELIDNLTAEMKRIRDKLNELKIQIDQTQLVVDREQQRNNDVFTELRTVQDNIETIPRQDIRTKYDEAIEARFRLTTMRGQLEKFISTREQSGAGAGTPARHAPAASGHRHSADSRTGGTRKRARTAAKDR